MFNSDDDKYVVLLRSTEDVQITVIAEALAKFEKIPFLEAAKRARGFYGFASDEVTEKKARDWAAKLAEVKINTVTVKQSDIKKLPLLQWAAQINFTAEGLNVTTKKEKSLMLSPGKMMVLSAGCIKTFSVKTSKIQEGPTGVQQVVKMGILMSTGLPLPIGPKKQIVESKQTETETFFYLDIISKDPLSWLRIDAQHIDYSFLKDRMEATSMINFKLLLNDLNQLGPSAQKNILFQAMLKSTPISALCHDSLAEFERESHWLYNIA